MADSVTSTPKRKHSQLLEEESLGLDTTIFSFDLYAPAEDGSASPRTKVAHRFRGLALDGGGGVGGGREAGSPEPPAGPHGNLVEQEQDGARKRLRLPLTSTNDAGGTKDFASGQTVAFAQAHSGWPTEARPPGEGMSTAAEADRAVVSTTSVRFAVQDTATTSSEPTQSQIIEKDGGSAEGGNDVSHGHKRAGTPPLTSRTNPASAELESDEAIITDPIRAALTWHEDEITVYDPDDSDDDGTGINGIGFKPTPAIAYARTIKRKQQLAEYRKREDREARARRNQRRRGSPATGLVDVKGKAERRRVRFMESAAEVVGTV